jgi:hypothetical protein
MMLAKIVPARQSGVDSVVTREDPALFLKNDPNRENRVRNGNRAID